VSNRPSYSRKTIRHLLRENTNTLKSSSITGSDSSQRYDAKSVRKGIDGLRGRIEKHFAEADEETLARGLVTLACKECERQYEKTLERLENLVKEVYPPMEGEKPVEIDFSKADIQAAFRR
jgi:hypothetical protein